MTKDIPMIAETLRSLNDDGLLTARQLASILSISTSSAYRYLSGEVEPTWSQVRTLFRHCGRREIQQRLAGDLLDGAGWLAEPVEVDADVNGDGHVDTNDVLDGALHATRSCADALGVARGAQRAGFKGLGPADAAMLREQLHDVCKTSVAALRAVDLIAAR